MKILWAVSSVGKGHVARDLALVCQLKKLADVEIDWLAPDPAGDFLRERGFNVLECSSRLAGSGKAYEKVFSGCTNEFNLMKYTRADTSLHRHDFRISSAAWKDNNYDLVVGDEAFWLLSGFAKRWGEKPSPFIFLTDFIGTKAMRSRPADLFTAWFTNLQFSFSHMGPDIYLYIGDAEEIPDEKLGFLLPGRKKWAQKHCRFVRPIANFDQNSIQDKSSIRKKLDLPEQTRLFTAIIGPEGNYRQRLSIIEQVFEILKGDFSETYFIITCPEKGNKNWIHYHQFIDDLYQYFAASDFVVSQSGYGKVIELSSLGTPFIALPLDYHFEQEYVMRFRLEHYGTGKLVTMRDHTPQSIAAIIKQTIDVKTSKLDVGTGAEVADIILKFKK